MVLVQLLYGVRLAAQPIFERILAPRALRGAASVFPVLRSSRLPLQVQARVQQDKYGMAQVQGVRLRRSAKRGELAIALLLPFVFWGIFHYSVSGRHSEILDELQKFDEEDEESEFIAFPLTTQLVQPGGYFLNDPEIVEYRKISKDPAIVQQIIKDAASWAASQIPQHGYSFKHMKLKPHRSWLDAKFQEMPPPYYTQSGLELGDDFIAWSTMAVESDVAQRIDRVLYPVPATKALWNFVRVAFTWGDANEKAGQILTEHLKLSTARKWTYDQVVAATPRGQEAAKERRDAARRKAADVAIRLSSEQEKAIDTKLTTSNGSPPSEVSPHQSSTPAGNKAQASEKQTPSTWTEWARKRKDGEMTEEEEQALKQFFLSSPIAQAFLHVSKRFQYANAVSKFTFMKESKPMVCPPPRGAVKVSGLMQMLIPNGWMMFDVEMHWDPKTRDFDEHSFKADMVKMSVNRKTPAGYGSVAASTVPGR